MGFVARDSGLLVPDGARLAVREPVPHVAEAKELAAILGRGWRERMRAIDGPVAMTQVGAYPSTSEVGLAGSWNTSTSESRTNVAYGSLTTPDQVANVVLPANGLIVVGFQALWSELVAGAARAAIFLGATQVQLQAFDGANRGSRTQAAATGSAVAAINTPLCASSFGLLSVNGAGAYPADVTTGQVLGFASATTSGSDAISMELGGTVTIFGGGSAAPRSGPSGGLCYIFAAAGTYTVGVQFKASSGSVTALNRKGWVGVLGT